MKKYFSQILPAVAALLPALIVSVPHDWRYLPLHVAVFAIVMVVAWQSATISRQFRDAPLYRWTAMLLGAAAVAWCLFGESVQSDWWIIDDHEIHMLIGAGRETISPSHLPSQMLAHKEIANPDFTWTRYRPAYYGLRLAEASAWGKSVEPWLWTRFILFVFTCVLGFDLLRQWLGFVSAAAGLAMFTVLALWPELVVQLGPPESYAAPACVAFAWCATHILRGRSPIVGPAWLGLALSACVAVGSKENFVILAPLAIVVAVYAQRQRRLGMTGILACLVICAVATWVAFVVGMGIASNGGRDVYQRPVGLSGFIQAGNGSFLRAVRKILTIGLPLAAIAAWSGYLAWRGRRNAFASYRNILVVTAVLSLIALSQFVFYRGVVFQKCRYDLPFVPLVCILSVGLLWVMARGRSGLIDARVMRRLLIPGVLTIVALAFGGDRTRAYTHDYVVKTNRFMELIRKAVLICEENPQRPLELIPSRDIFGSYEPVLSVAEYLTTAGVTNPLFLNPQNLNALSDGRRRSFLDESLRRKLLDISNKGGSLFQPWSEMPSHSVPLQLWFAADPDIPGDLNFSIR